MCEVRANGTLPRVRLTSGGRKSVVPPDYYEHGYYCIYHPAMCAEL